MLDVQQALGAANRTAAKAPAAARRALVIGGAGPLGAAVLEQLLGTQRFERVGALVDQPVRAALRGFAPVEASQFAGFGADTALIVFNRARHAFGREAAFVQPAPTDLPAWSVRVREAGAHCLIVVVPHAPSLLPMALQQGLATLDESAVAAMGFEHLVFMRMAQSDAANPARDAPQRLARWMLSQLHWMIPQREQPVCAQTVAKVAAALAVSLPATAPATRVMPAALLWQAAQQRDVGPTVQAWIEAQETLGSA